MSVYPNPKFLRWLRNSLSKESKVSVWYVAERTMLEILEQVDCDIIGGVDMRGVWSDTYAWMREFRPKDGISLPTEKQVIAYLLDRYEEGRCYD